MYIHHSTWQVPEHKTPNGLASAQDVFQNQSDQTFGDIPNVYYITDDILIAAPSQKEQNVAIQKISQHAKARGFKLSPEKAKIPSPKLKFYRCILIKEGVQPDTQKVAALLCMSAPRDKQELKSLVGCEKDFDPSQEIYVGTDASGKGLGCVLMQPGESGDESKMFPVHFTSRSLSTAEDGYSNIEHETQGMVFAIKHLH